MLKKGEADIAIAFLDGAVAAEVQRDPQLRLVDTRHASIVWLEFADQWDPKSPWHDRRGGGGANYAPARPALKEAGGAGFFPPPPLPLAPAPGFAVARG